MHNRAQLDIPWFSPSTWGKRVWPSFKAYPRTKLTNRTKVRDSRKAFVEAKKSKGVVKADQSKAFLKTMQSRQSRRHHPRLQPQVTRGPCHQLPPLAKTVQVVQDRRPRSGEGLDAEQKWQLRTLLKKVCGHFCGPKRGLYANWPCPA